MTRKRAKELLPIIEAFANGAEIYYQHGPYFGKRKVEDPCFNSEGEWSIKPEPRTIKLCRSAGQPWRQMVFGDPSSEHQEQIEVVEVVK